MLKMLAGVTSLDERFAFRPRRSFLRPTSDVIVMTEQPTSVPFPADAAISRRQVFKVGGVAVGFSALIAACAEGAADVKPARVGTAAPAKKLAAVVVNDGVLFRTAASLHYSIIDAHNAAKEHGKLSQDQVAIVDAYIAANTDAIASIDVLTIEAGGKPFGCANPRFDRVIVVPLVARITGRPKVGNEEADVAPSDDPTRDALAMAHSDGDRGCGNSSIARSFADRTSSARSGDGTWAGRCQASSGAGIGDQSQEPDQPG